MNSNKKISNVCCATICVLFTSCLEEEHTVPDGIKIVSRDKNSFFTLADKQYWGDRYLQRSAGHKICKANGISGDYCEVYFFSNIDDVPTKFPIINRMNAMGVYKVNYGKKYLKPLPAEEDEYDTQKIFKFFKDIYRKAKSNFN